MSDKIEIDLATFQKFAYDVQAFMLGLERMTAALGVFSAAVAAVTAEGRPPHSSDRYRLAGQLIAERHAAAVRDAAASATFVCQAHGSHPHSGVRCLDCWQCVMREPSPSVRIDPDLTPGGG